MSFYFRLCPKLGLILFGGFPSMVDLKGGAQWHRQKALADSRFRGWLHLLPGKAGGCLFPNAPWSHHSIGRDVMDPSRVEAIWFLEFCKCDLSTHQGAKGCTRRFRSEKDGSTCLMILGDVDHHRKDSANLIKWNAGMVVAPK